jgi:hypothetical protein
MFITQAKLTSYKKQITQFTITFSVPNETDELQLIQNLKTDGYLAFNPDLFKKKVEDFMKNKSIGVDDEGKSESTKLRGKIYIIWEDAFAAKKTTKTAEQFYIDTMQWIRNKLIEKLL